MLREPTDADGFVLPQVRPESAWDAASAFTSVASAMQSANDALSGALPSAVCWSGEAADAYREVRERLDRRAYELAEVASAAAGVVLGWLREAAPAFAAMKVVAAQAESLQVRIDAAAAGLYDPAVDAALQRELDDLLRRWHTARGTYWDAVDTAARRLLALRDGISARHRDLQDHVEGAGRAAWSGYVSDPAQAAWDVTGQALTDRDAWWDDVSALPGQTYDAIEQLLTDPLGSAGSVLEVEAWSDGRYGEAAAGLAVTLLPGPKWLSLGKDVGAVRFAANRADPQAPRPTLQTVDEMLDGVDLERHEHYALGHTLRRHVNVDDDYLMDRLTHGTLLDDPGRGSRPPAASRFYDRATAEKVITQVLREHEADLRALERLPIGATMNVDVMCRDPIGEVMRSAPGGFELDAGRQLLLTMKLGPDGPYVYTAFIK